MNKEKNLKQLRDDIDIIDKEIMSLLNKRMEISKEIKQYKASNNIAVSDKKRELEILDKCNGMENENSIKTIYNTIFHESKKIQTNKIVTGLLGLSLPYTYSDEIHKYFGNDNYQILETNDPTKYFNKFKYLNITNPFKKDGYNYAVNNNFTLDNASRDTKVVNCISISDNNSLTAYNLDEKAFLNELDYYKINVNNKNILIIGNGDTSKSVERAVKSRKPKSIMITARHPLKDEILLSEIYNTPAIQAVNIIINATSYGVFPNLMSEPIIRIDNFSQLEYVIDINYNPMRSTLLLEATKKGVKTSNGLYMLVENGRLSEEIWQNRKIPNTITAECVKHLTIKHSNIILIGMPYSGKTTIGLELSKMMSKSFIDTDKILNDKNISINKCGLTEFRTAENELSKSITTSYKSTIISTGGGLIENLENINFLKQNGIVIMLNTPLDLLKTRIGPSRPLADNENKLIDLYNKRHKMYLDAADIIVDIKNESVYKNALKIMEKIYEYYDN